MKIAMAHRTGVYLTFVIADQKRNALSKPIHVHLAIANVALMKHVHPQESVHLGSV